MAAHHSEDEPWLVLCSGNDGESEQKTGEGNSGLPHCISTLLCGDGSHYKRLLETLTELRGEADLGLPTIVVCGVQSHGKSSTLERIAQREVFPRDSSLSTRMVVRLMLRNSAEKETKARIFDTEEDKGIRPSWTDVPEGMSVPEATRAIMRDFVNSNHEGDSSAIDCRHELQVMLQAPNVPTIDLVDLPGIDGLADDAGPMLLAKQYLANEHTLVVAVACASDKLIRANAVWRLLSESENPAVVALTHMDMSRQSAADIIDILNKQPKFVAECGSVQSVIPVVNRDTLRASEQVSLKDALASEKAMLAPKLEEIGVRFDPSQHGICAVVGALGDMLHEYMADTWVRAELDELSSELVPIAKELGELGAQPQVVTRDEIDEAIETAWAHLLSCDLDQWHAAIDVNSSTDEETESVVPLGLRIEQAGDLEQQFETLLDGRMVAALRSVQSMLVESIQSVCAEPPVKLVRFSAIVQLCQEALQDVFEADKSNIRSKITDRTQRMIEDAMLSLNANDVDVSVLNDDVRTLVFKIVAYSLLRRGAFLSAIASRLGTGVQPALIVDADAERRQELNCKIKLISDAVNVLSAISPTCPETKQVVADIDKVVEESKSGRVSSDSISAISERIG